MKITPETLKAVTKKLTSENRKMARRISEKSGDDEKLNVIDALKELEKFALDDDEILDDEVTDKGGDDTNEPENKDPDKHEDDAGDDDIVDLDNDKDDGDDNDDDDTPPTDDGNKDDTTSHLDDLKKIGLDDDASIEIGNDEDNDNKDDNDATVDLDDADDDGVVIDVTDGDDETEVDESLLGDALKSIGSGIKGLAKLCGKGVLVLIAGLGGSFLFGLPGLLLAVMIAFGLMGGSNECTGKTLKQINEGLGADIKNKIKNVLKILKGMDKEELKKLNDQAKKDPKAVAAMIKSGKLEDQVDNSEPEVTVAEKHGDKNNKGWRKNRKPVKEGDDCGYGVFLRGELKQKFDTREEADEWANDNYDLDVYGDDVTIEPLDCADEVEISEDGDLASKLDELDADELKKLNPEQKEKLQDILAVEDDANECDKEISSPEQIVEFLKECKTVKSSVSVKHAARRYAKMVKESPVRAKLIAKRLNKKFGDKPVSESRFCKVFTKALLG